MHRPKFRIWDPKERRMMNLVDMAVPMDMLEFIANDDPHSPIEGPHIHLWHVIEQTIEASGAELIPTTGVNDSRRVEIFAGDIVWTDHNFGSGFGASLHMGVIEYSSGEYLLRNGAVATSLASLARNRWKLEVRGNKYQHPGLLEEL